MAKNLGIKMPKVTFLMPVHNVAEYLPETIESILCQTFTDFGLLIINDGSTDESLGVIQFYAKEDERIKIINRENYGLAATLNEGINLTNGRYIAPRKTTKTSRIS